MTIPTPRPVRAAALFAALALAGCSTSPKSPDVSDAEVVVTVNGQPLPNAFVTLTPTGAGFDATASATGTTDDTGRAKLTCNGKPGACVGPNKLTVSDPAGSEESRGQDGAAQLKAGEELRALKNRPIPTKYLTLAQSDVTVDVKRGEKEYKVDLKR